MHYCIWNPCFFDGNLNLKEFVELGERLNALIEKFFT